MILGALLGIALSLQPQETPTPPPAGEVAASEAVARTADGRPVTGPKQTKHASPQWPPNALRAGLEGRVVLQFDIGTDGRVENPKVLAGHRCLGDAAVTAARKWRYQPAKLGGQPVAVNMTVTVDFTLKEQPKRRWLLESMHDPDPEIRWAAVRWLGRYRPITGEQRHALEVALRDPSELVRDAAEKALAGLEAQ